jgi:hypothetical protein
MPSFARARKQAAEFRASHEHPAMGQRAPMPVSQVPRFNRASPQQLKAMQARAPSYTQRTVPMRGAVPGFRGGVILHPEAPRGKPRGYIIDKRTGQRVRAVY